MAPGVGRGSPGQQHHEEGMSLHHHLTRHLHQHQVHQLRQRLVQLAIQGSGLRWTRGQRQEEEVVHPMVQGTVANKAQVVISIQEE